MVNPVDAWMDEKFKFAGSQIKRKTVACVLLGLPAIAPIFLAVLFFSFMINELLFKGIGAFRLQVPATPTPVH